MSAGWQLWHYLTFVLESGFLELPVVALPTGYFITIAELTGRQVMSLTLQKGLLEEGASQLCTQPLVRFPWIPHGGIPLGMS